MPSLHYSKNIISPPTLPNLNHSPPPLTTFAVATKTSRESWSIGRDPAYLHLTLPSDNWSKGTSSLFPARTFLARKEALAHNSSPLTQPNARKICVPLFCRRFIVTNLQGRTRWIKNRRLQSQKWPVYLERHMQGTKNNMLLTTTGRKFR